MGGLGAGAGAAAGLGMASAPGPTYTDTDHVSPLEPYGGAPAAEMPPSTGISGAGAVPYQEQQHTRPGAAERIAAATAARQAAHEAIQQQQQASAERAMSPGQMEEVLYERFLHFCPSTANGEMDSARFVKFCRDTNLFDRHFTTTEADLIFQRAKSRGNYAKRITFEEFRVMAFPGIAEAKRMRAEDLMRQVASVSGPVLSGTRAEPNRFHDDPSTYTGVYARGGPTTLDSGPTVRMENLLDRSPADARGVKVGDGGSASGSVKSGGSSGSGQPGGTGYKGSTIAGEANRPGGVFDRLTQERTFTGVYKKRFEGGAHGGRINMDTVNTSSSFDGSTNANSDEQIHDIRQIVTRR